MTLGQIIAGITGLIQLLLFIAMAIAGYMAPTIIAARRGHPNVAPIAVVNILLGWTLVGYVIALAWSFTAINRNP